MRSLYFGGLVGVREAKEGKRERKRVEMEVMTLVWFAGGFFGQLSIVIIRLRAILMLATQLLSCVQLPPGGESCWPSDSLITVNSLNVHMLTSNKAIICVDLREDTKRASCV